MAFLSKDDIGELYKESKTEARLWREAYPAYERLADNDLMDGLDPNLPEVNDGSLAAALFKLPKRIVSSKLSGTVKALDREEAWLSELANLQWQNEIIPNANTQAPFHRKLKDAVRKAAIYGSVPLITIFVEKNGKRTTDFIVAQPQDVTLEPGKISDYDSDVIFWDVYFTKLQVEQMIDQATEDKKNSDGDKDEYNKWDIPALKKILAANAKESREAIDEANSTEGKKKQSGFKFCVAVQRGKDAPFFMYHSGTKATVREWTNPDPTGDLPIHFLYCYQDFINPYGIGIVKLAGGTQNVLDYMRQADVLATQLGLRPPLSIEGNADNVDLDSIVYAQDALWFTGEAKVVRQELADGVYQALPGRMQMYQSSLQKLIPTGDTSLSASESGDNQNSKTPAGVKLAAANLSIDDEDFKDNLYMTYEALAKSMINTHFANMEGSDFMKLNDDEREILIKAGLQFPQSPEGEMSNQVEIQWDTARAEFDFEVDPEQDKAKDDADKLQGLQTAAELAASDPTFSQDLASAGKKYNKGEHYAEMFKLITDNDKIITDVSPEEQQGQEGASGQPQDAQQAPKMPSESLNYKDAPEDIKRQIEAQAGLQPSQMTSPGQAALDQKQQQLDQAAQQQQHSQGMDVVNAHQSAKQADQQHAQSQAQAQQPTKDSKGKQSAPKPATTAQPTPEEMKTNIEAVMHQFGVDEQTATTALAAEHEGLPIEDIINKLQEHAG